VLASVASYETEVRAERIAAGKAAKTAKIEAIIKLGSITGLLSHDLGGEGGEDRSDHQGGRHAAGGEQGRQAQGHPQQGDAHGADHDLADEGGEEEGDADRQGVELVEADDLRSAAAGMSRATLRSCRVGNSFGKTWEPGSISGPVDHRRLGLLHNAGVAIPGREELTPLATGRKN
jgi:hypothetical protein